MNTIFYWLIWTAVAVVGSKYSLEFILNRNFLWQHAIVVVLTYQWFTTLLNNSKNNISNQANKDEPSITIKELNQMIRKKLK